MTMEILPTEKEPARLYDSPMVDIKPVKPVNIEFEVLGLHDTYEALNSRLELLEHQNHYRETIREKTDWFSFENRIRDVVKDIIKPTLMRGEETREIARGLEASQSLVLSQCEELTLKIDDLNSERSESFQFNLMKNIGIKFA